MHDTDLPNTSPPLLLDVAEAARLLALAQVTIRRLVTRGDLPHVKIAGALRIPRAAVEALATPSPSKPKIETDDAPHGDGEPPINGGS